MFAASKPKGFEERDAPEEFRFDGDGTRPVVRGTPIVSMKRRSPVWP